MKVHESKVSELQGGTTATDAIPCLQSQYIILNCIFPSVVTRGFEHGYGKCQQLCANALE